MTFQEVVVSFFLFTALYFEVFMLLTLFQSRKRLSGTPLIDTSKPGLLPSVTIIVPCYNEEKTVTRTVESILALDYPREKLFISIVDDGSKDNTWNHVSQWQDHPQITLHRKANGGKYTALNHGIEHATTDIVGCLDADSFVEPDALRKMVYMFYTNPKTMAIAPAVKIWKPNNAIRSMQYVEYIYGIFIKKLFGLLDAIHVTPGPFSLFRREVFAEVGYFKHAHNTEDMEIAMRLQKNGKKIDNCHDAYVYTVGPKTVRALHKQRLRWTHGFMRNAIDYRDMFFNRRFGNVGFITLPFSVTALLGTLVAMAFLFSHFIVSSFEKISRLNTIGWKFSLPHLNLDLFFISTRITSILSLSIFFIAVGMIFMAIIVTGNRVRVRDLLFYFTLYPFMALAWILRSFWNLAFVRTTSWR